MEFKNLSGAIANVINSYHAYKTETPLVSVDLNAPLETFVQILHDKIIEATTGSNSQSSRRTLLEYMLRGMKLSEQARISEDPDEIEALKPQLVQFIQNIQQLFKGPYFNMFTGSMLLIPADETNDLSSLSIYYLNSPTSEAYQLTQKLLLTLELSPESTITTVEKHIGELFFTKKHHVLLEENAKLKAKIQILKQRNETYEEQIENIANKTSRAGDQIDDTKTPMDTKAHTWEVVGFNFEGESEEARVQHLSEANEKLQKRHEELQQRSQMLQTLLNGQLKEKTKKTPSKNRFSVVTKQPKADAVATSSVVAASRSNLTTRNQRPTTRTSLLMNFLFPPQPYGCGYDFQRTEPDPSLDKFNKIN